MTDDTGPIGPRTARAFVVAEAAVPVERWDPPAPGVVSWRTLLSADRTPTRGITLGSAEIDPGEQGYRRVHRHEPDEFYVFLAGTGTVMIDGTEHDVTAGSTVFVPGGAWHAVRNTGEGPLRLLYGFGVDSFADVVYEFADEV